MVFCDTGTFPARDNIAQFIAFARQLGIPDDLMFETNDLVMKSSIKQVIYWCVSKQHILHDCTLTSPNPSSQAHPKTVSCCLKTEYHAQPDGSCPLPARRGASPIGQDGTVLGIGKRGVSLSLSRFTEREREREKACVRA